MTEPNTIVVVDEEGVRRWASRNAQFVVDGLADGTLREVDDAAVPAPGDDHNTGGADGPTSGGSGDGERTAPDARNENGDGVAGATASRSDRRRR